MQRSKTSSNISREIKCSYLDCAARNCKSPWSCYHSNAVYGKTWAGEQTVSELSKAKEKGTKGKKPGKERKGYRCGGTGHLAQDKSCPALDKTCNKRGKSGHFAACCKTKSTKKPSGRHRSEVHVHDSHGQQIMKVPLTLKRIINSQGFDAAVYNKCWCRCWIKKRWLLPRISFMELSLS